MIVGADGDTVLFLGLPCFHADVDRKLIVLLSGVAHISRRRRENPIGAIDAILRALDTTGRVAGDKLDCDSHVTRLALAPIGGIRRQAFNRRWRVVHDEALAFALRAERGGWRV